jgi:hypothetical protein
MRRDIIEKGATVGTEEMQAADGGLGLGENVKTRGQHRRRRRRILIDAPSKNGFEGAVKNKLAVRHPDRGPTIIMIECLPLPREACPFDPHSTRCTAGCHTSRDFVHWRFLDAGQLSLLSVSSLPASKNQHTTGLMHRGKQHRYSITSSARSSSDDGTFIRPRIWSVHASVEIEFPNRLSHTCQRQ